MSVFSFFLDCHSQGVHFFLFAFVLKRHSHIAMSDIESKLDAYRLQFEHADREVMKKADILAKNENLAILTKSNGKWKLQQQYLEIKEKLTELGFDKFYCVIKTVWGYHKEYRKMDGKKYSVRNKYPDHEYYHTPLLCFLDDPIEPLNTKNYWSDVSYEILTEFSSFKTSATIDDMISMGLMDGDESHPHYSAKSITRMRKYAEKFDEKDQFENWLLILIDKFPSTELAHAILEAKDQKLTTRMMPWIKENGNWIGCDMIIPAVDDFPIDMIRELVASIRKTTYALLGKIIDMAQKRSNDVVLIDILNKPGRISSDDLSIEQRAYMRALLRKIDHPCIEEAYADKIEEIRTLKKQKLIHEIDRDQIQKQGEKLPILDEEIQFDQKKIEELLLTCPVSVREFVNK